MYRLLTGLEDDDALETSVLGWVDVRSFELVDDVVKVADTCQQRRILVTWRHSYVIYNRCAIYDIRSLLCSFVVSLPTNRPTTW